MDAYSSIKGVDKVIFIGRTDKIANAVKAAMRDSYYPDWERPVGFGSLEDWLKDPGKATIALSENTTSLARLSEAAE